MIWYFITQRGSVLCHITGRRRKEKGLEGPCKHIYCYESAKDLTFIEDSVHIKPGTSQPQAGVCLFSKIDSVWLVSMLVCVCGVCPHPRLFITRCMIWHDMNLIQLVKQVLQLLYGNCSRYY